MVEQASKSAAVLGKTELRKTGAGYRITKAHDPDPSLGEQFLVAVRPLADRLVKPSAVPIYIQRSGEQPDHYGTAFLVPISSRKIT